MLERVGERGRYLLDIHNDMEESYSPLDTYQLPGDKLFLSHSHSTTHSLLHMSHKLFFFCHYLTFG